MRFDQKIKEAEEIDAKLKIVSADINNKKQKFDHQKSILDDLQSATDNAFGTIRKVKRKSIFSISFCLEKKQKLSPSSKSKPSCSKTRGRKETMTACMKIHGGTVLKKEPVLHGMLDTLTTQFKTKTLTKKILNTEDYLTNNI